jgi:hypothetical protein
VGALEGVPFEEVVDGVGAFRGSSNDAYVRQQAIEGGHEDGDGVTGGVEEGGEGGGRRCSNLEWGKEKHSKAYWTDWLNFHTW